MDEHADGCDQGELEEDDVEDEVDPAGNDDGGLAALAAVGLSLEELSNCTSVLVRLHEAQAAGTLDSSAKCLRPVRKALSLHLGKTFAHLPQKDAIDERERKRAEKDRKRERRQRQVEADKRWKENAQLRAARLAQLEALEATPAQDSPKALLPAPAGYPAEQSQAERKRIPDGPAPSDSCMAAPAGEEFDAEESYSRQQACYICKARFSDRHHFYSHLCPPCAALNFERRHRRCNMSGRVCIVTGARVKIGFQTALKLLRMGARVLATTRFPQDAHKRYAAEADSAEWLDRLQVIGADFRFLAGIERLCSELCARESHLDVLINNACQTVRRPAAYYAHLLEAEAAAAGAAGMLPTYAGDAGNHGGLSSKQAQLCQSDGGLDVLGGNSAAMSQIAVLAEDRMKEEEAALALPAGERDVHGQQLDLRSSNSWLLKLGEVETPEAVEVFCINALAPFVLTSRLRPLMERSPHPDRYVVNVSAMEGKFYRYKQPTHPHTNMAKAALNMLTRTSAEDLALSSGIYMNSVDTGWINDENPLPTAQRIAESHGFQTPIDEVDAAARIIDPVLTGMEITVASAGDAAESCKRRPRKGGGGAGGGGACNVAEGAEAGPPWGRFLKDYMQSEW